MNVVVRCSWLSCSTRTTQVNRITWLVRHFKWREKDNQIFRDMSKNSSEGISTQFSLRDSKPTMWNTLCHSDLKQGNTYVLLTRKDRNAIITQQTVRNRWTGWSGLFVPGVGNDASRTCGRLNTRYFDVRQIERQSISTLIRSFLRNDSAYEEHWSIRNRASNGELASDIRYSF